MFRLLRRLWNFDLLLWLACRYGHEYKYYCLYLPRKSRTKRITFQPNVSSAEFLAQVRSTAIAPDADDDFEELPPDKWRTYG